MAGSIDSVSVIFHTGAVVSVFGRGTSFDLPERAVKSGKTGESGPECNLMNRHPVVQQHSGGFRNPDSAQVFHKCLTGAFLKNPAEMEFRVAGQSGCLFQ